MLSIGDPSHSTKDGNRGELRFVRGEEIVATVYTDYLKSFEVSKVTGGFDSAVILMHARPGDSALSGVPNEGVLEFWAETPAHPGLIRITRVRIEYWNLESDEQGVRLEIQGRGLGAALVDVRWNQTWQGTVAMFVSELSTAVNVPIVVQDVSADPIVAYVNSPSAFGALRLIAASLGLVVAEHEDGIKLASTDSHDKELRARSPVRLEEGQVRSMNVRKGTPIRRR